MIVTTVLRALHREPAARPDGVHFHIGGNGLPQVCDRHRCESPGLTAEDLGLTRA